MSTKTQDARIIEIGEDTGPEPWACLIRAAFAAVAREYGLTPSNCPSHPAFLETERLAQMRAEGAHFLGLSLADRLVGLVAVKIRGMQCHIEKLSVLPVYRHRGYGRRLMDAAQDYARERGCRQASIGIIDENRILKGWYGAMGFAVAETRSYDHLPFTVCMMVKSL